MQQTATHCAITLSMNQPLSRPSATLSPPCGERAGRGVPIWFMASIHVRILEVSPSHEPPPHPIPLPLRGGEGARRAGEGGLMVPMHAEQGKRAFHEPAVGVRTAMSKRIKSEALADKAVRAPVRRWFMVPMRDSEIVEASHEPCTLLPAFSPLGGGGTARVVGGGAGRLVAALHDLKLMEFLCHG